VPLPHERFWDFVSLSLEAIRKVLAFDHPSYLVYKKFSERHGKAAKFGGAGVGPTLALTLVAILAELVFMGVFLIFYYMLK
jgi:hypothetical protein